MKKLAFAKLRMACATLPGATQDIKWGTNMVYSVGQKMFAVTDEDSAFFSFKVDDDRFLELTDRPGIIPAPYLARAKWIQIKPDCALTQDEAKALLQRAHAHCFSPG